MKIFKMSLVVLLISVVAMSCKTEKKEADKPMEEVVEVEEEKSSEDDSAKEETVEKETKQLTVVYSKDTKLATEVSETIKSLIKDNPELKAHFNSAHGFVIFPKITKAGLGLGGAGGKGLLFEDNSVIGGAKLAQATIGFQAGAQQYSEVIFFENKSAIDKFKAEKLKFAGQVSAVAIKTGTSLDLNYQDGVAVFTKAGVGLMAEASVGGQKFSYKDGI